MRKFVKIAFVAVFAATTGYGVYTSQKSEVMSDLALANAEALASGESSTGDCVYDPTSSCILLHPTDPTKDDEKPNRRW